MKVNSVKIELCKYEALLNRISKLERINEKQDEKLSAIDALISDGIDKCINDNTRNFGYVSVCMEELFAALRYDMKPILKTIEESRKNHNNQDDETGGYAE